MAIERFRVFSVMFEAEVKILGWNSTGERTKLAWHDADVAVPSSTVRILVIAAREDLAIMRETRQLLTSTGEPQ